MAGREFFLWQVRSFTVRISLDLVDSLNAALSDKSNAEVGGILTGRELASNQIEICGFEFIESEHRRGVIYSLGLREQLSMAERAARLPRKSGLKAVGFFRTHLRRGLFLDQDDFSLMQEAFSDPSQIAMLIRHIEPGPDNAGVFIWEEGDIDRRQTTAFPFDSQTLRAQGPIFTEAIPEPRSSRRTPTSIPMPVIPIRWIAWGAATAAGALALGAVLPKLQLRPAPVRANAKVIKPISAVVPAVVATRVSPPAEVQVAQVEPAPVPAAFISPRPDEGQQKVEPAVAVSKPAAVARTFSLPEPPAPRVQNEVVAAAVAPPPIVPAVVERAATPIPESVAAPIPEPSLPAPRPEPRPEPTVVRSRPSVQVAVSMEARESSELTKVVGHVPLFGHFAHAEGGKEFSPAHPGSSIEPRVPAWLASNLVGTLSVDVKLSIDKHGAVTNYEVLHGAGSQFASLAVSMAGNAAWEPARKGDHRVNSDVIVHYRFEPGR